jgi:geranylgeranyl pyrophosphate synthase
LTDFALNDWANGLRARVDEYMHSRFEDAWPSAFQTGCRYPLQTGGKRIRPLFVFGVAQSLGQAVTDDLIAVGAAVELVHTYSLVHDDLPCMDDDAMRRGRPTVHKVYDEGTAVLIGDALLTEAFRTLAQCGLDAEARVALVSELASAAGHVGMIGGQALDIGMNGPITDLDELIRLHRGKTGALIRGALRMGAIAMAASSSQIEALTTYGEAIGLAFQMADDVLDAEQDAGASGPPSSVRLVGVKQTSERASRLLEDALLALASLPHSEALAALARFTVARDH